MSGPVSIDAIKAGLIARLDELVPRLFPNAKRDGQEWRLGDVHGAPGRSLGIRRTGGRAGVWADFASGASGDVLDLVAAGACSGDVGSAIVWARRYLGYGDIDPAARDRIEAEAATSRQRAERAAREEQERKVRHARAVFLNAAPLHGSPAERYLLGRAINLTELERLRGERLRGARFARLLDPEWKIERPVLVLPIMQPDGSMSGAHRTFLHVLPDGRVIKASSDPDRPMADCKLSLGAMRGGFLPLWRPTGAGRFCDPAPAEAIMVTEGAEDGYSSALELPDLRHVAGISLGNVATLGPALARFSRVFWHRHRETKPETTAKGERVTEQLMRAGCNVTEVWAPGGHKDFNDARRAALQALPIGHAENSI